MVADADRALEIARELHRTQPVPPNAELLALVVGSGVRGQSAVETCRTLLREVGGLAGLARRGVAELRTLRGIGPARAAALVAATELGWRLQGARVAPFSPLSRSERVYHTVLPRLGGRRQELFVVLALDSRHRLLSLTQVAQGSATGVEVHELPLDAERVFLSLKRAARGEE